MSDLLNNDQMQAPGVPTLTLTPTMSDLRPPWLRRPKKKPQPRSTTAC